MLPVYNCRRMGTLIMPALMYVTVSRKTLFGLVGESRGIKGRETPKETLGPWSKYHSLS